MKATYPLARILAVSTILVFNSAILHAAVTDEGIESSVKKSYVFRTFLSEDAITAHASEGVVTLTGTVSDTIHKSLAQDTVVCLSGVKRVDNQLVVKESDPNKYSDEWLTVKVKTALLFHRNVNAKATTVSVKNGSVTLGGQASSQAQKDLTTEDAKDVEGVKDVTNEMSIAAAATREEMLGEQIDDASITAQVESTLMLHQPTIAAMAEVETAEGVVTVSGFAKNAAEKSLVTKLTTNTHGVRSVINKMTVEVKAASIN